MLIQGSLNECLVGWPSIYLSLSLSLYTEKRSFISISVCDVRLWNANKQLSFGWTETYSSDSFLKDTHTNKQICIYIIHLYMQRIISADKLAKFKYSLS